MLNVVCIQTQNYCGRGVDYVANLRRCVKRNLTIPNKFYVITDDVASLYPGCVVKPAMYRGWWEKLRIFKPGMFQGRVLFLDLDTIVLKNIDHIAAYQGHFACPHDFWNPKGLGPAVMLFDPEWASFIYEEWAACGFPMTDPRGDQGWIEGRKNLRPDILQDLYPGEFVSYKASCTNGVPDGARVVCFHGKPRPHEAGGWVTEHWKEAAYA